MPKPLPVPIRSSDLLRVSGDDRQLRRLAERGIWARVAPGAYVDGDVWRQLKERERYLTSVHARLLRLPRRVVASHWSAAAAWGFPVPDDWPRKLQIIDPNCSKTSTTATILRRAGPIDSHDVCDWDGCSVTRPARTAVDIGLADGFEAGVLVMDFGLHTGLFEKADLLRQLEGRRGARRFTSTLTALDFAHPAAESPGESFSRMAIASRGFPLPTLQEPFSDRDGRIGRVDFYWEESGIVGEFDGLQKYRDPEVMDSRSAVEVIRDEKRRHARLDAHTRVKRVVRWDYPVARRPDELARRLLAVGLARVDGGFRRGR
ncbi:MAG: hypothetical protein JWP75_150 [Frondihabitans sp.]|nr:hypothetical protein [Frondihabitans sp.]